MGIDFEAAMSDFTYCDPEDLVDCADCGAKLTPSMSYRHGEDRVCFPCYEVRVADNWKAVEDELAD